MLHINKLQSWILKKIVTIDISINHSQVLIKSTAEIQDEARDSHNDSVRSVFMTLLVSVIKTSSSHKLSLSRGLAVCLYVEDPLPSALDV